MIGAIIGDTAGSIYEFNNIKRTDIELFTKQSDYTDDSIMSFAVAKWLLTDPLHTHKSLQDCMVEFGNKYRHPMGGYGGSFASWLFCSEEERKPYKSWGNGSAMRVSAVGWFFDTIEETENVAKISAEVTHNHPEGIKGAQATAAAIYMARTGKSKAEIKQYIETRFKYDLNRTCDMIRPTYQFNESCQGTVPEAIIAFLDSTDFENAIRLGISLGGDSDTLTCITGAIAEAFYKSIPSYMIDEVNKRLPSEFKLILEEMKAKSL